jgi:hypothetical protein
MPTEEPEAAPVKLSELVDACEFVSVSDLDEHQAYICKWTGRIIFVAEGVDLEEDIEFLDDPELADYLPVPHRRDFDLSRRLALSFVAEELPGSFDKTTAIFSRFKQLHQATGTLDKWHAFEARATQTALEEWCDEVGVTLIDNEQPA